MRALVASEFHKWFLPERMLRKYQIWNWTGERLSLGLGGLTPAGFWSCGPIIVFPEQWTEVQIKQFQKERHQTFELRDLELSDQFLEEVLVPLVY